MTFGQRLTTLRESRDLTMSEAAAAAGAPLKQWRKWEDDVQKPQVVTLGSIATGIRMSPSDLWWLVTGIRSRSS